MDRRKRHRNTDVARAVRKTRDRLSQQAGNPEFDRELLKLHARAMTSGAIAVPLLVLGVAALGLFAGMGKAIGVWALFALICYSIVAFMARRVERTEAAELNTVQTRREFLVGHFLCGVSWAYFAWLGCSVCEVDQFQVVKAVVLLFAMAATAVLASSLRGALLATFTIPVAIYAYAGASLWKPVEVTMVALLIISLPFFAYVARHLHRSSLMLLSFRSEKDGLIAELETAKAMSDEARRRAEDANLAKSRFLASMSHELRTPLNAILGFSEVMANEVLGPINNTTYRDYAHDVHESGQHLLDLINEILDLSRIEAGRYQLNEEPVMLLSIVEDCCHMMELKARNKDIRVIQDFESVLPRLFADERAVRQITLNLLSNAIKFTLTVPPKYVLDEMDRHGMLAYIEYPIWHPVESDDFFSRSRSNITEMVIKDRNHPSVIMSDFSCEMPTFSPQMDSLMLDLYNMGKSLAPNRLFLDNSSVGMTKYGDFYATHPYYQLNKFKEVIDVWANVRASGGLDKPLILGEYADTDTIRNTTAIKNANGGTLPWWWTMFGTKDPETILQNQGFSLGQIDTFRSSSVANAQMSKKYYIEASKMNSRVAGLFVTHIRDIAQTQAGFYDDNGDLKFDSAELKKSTNPTTLLLERQTLNVWGGSSFTVSPKLSHYDGTAITNGTVAWRLMANGTAVSSGTSQTGVALANGDVYDLNAITFTTPDSASPYKYTLQVTLTANSGEYLITNDWPVWVYPNKPLSNPDKTVQVYDPANKLDLTTRYPWMTTWANDNPDLLITTDWSSAIDSYLNNGGKVLYVGHGAGPVTSNSSTFNIWAYAFIPNGHPALGQFPHEGFSDQQFLDLATDYSLDYNGFYGGTNLAAHQPIIARMDLRGYSVSSYLSEFNVGSGQLLQTTLRLDSLAAGGDLAGDLNTDHDARENVAGKYLLDQLLKYELGLVVSGNKAAAANLVETSSADPMLNGALAIDGIKQIWGSGEWASNGEERPWIRLTWNSGITIESVKLYDRSNPYDNIQSGTLTFSDGSSVAVGALDNAGDPTTVTFPVKSGITWIKFQVDSSNPGWLNNGLSEIEVF